MNNRQRARLLANKLYLLVYEDDLWHGLQWSRWHAKILAILENQCPAQQVSNTCDGDLVRVGTPARTMTYPYVFVAN
jgi:hypothetical protein